ncbi:LytR/AlgR family response regulator transcription factor [Fibrella aquatilis]|uniref:Response regulator transcription factor n=1 Tax=Fibrella aquatilis TaxID=2817059 RepID=A0A939K0Z4_9BACT|nr:LytTR family DNA-binding domain-containing protein [Fibrella aquatilis]MBO0932978.1 response regulator transcription factor [Fibrella aquatilis]
MINCFILDDEQAAIDVLTQYIGNTPYLNLVGSTTSVKEAIHLLQQHPAELLFLDIQMPLLTGLQFASLYKDKLQIIFTTAYSNYAIDGFEHNALDYLLKPIPFDRFLKASEKAFDFFNRQIPAISGTVQLPENDYILVKTEHKGKLRKISFDEIIYIEGLKNYVSIHTEKEPIVTYSGMAEIEERLPTHLFARVHRSYIVALRMINAIDGNELFMKNAPRIPTSGKYKDDLMAVLQKSILQNK